MLELDLTLAWNINGLVIVLKFFTCNCSSLVHLCTKIFSDCLMHVMLISFFIFLLFINYRWWGKFGICPVL